MFDLNQIDSIQSEDDVYEAINETFNPDLPVSPTFIFSVRAKIKRVARQLGCYEDAVEYIEQLSREFKNCNYHDKILQKCTLDRHGNPYPTTDNIITILREDPQFRGLRMNELSMRYEYLDENNDIKAWTDAQDAAARTYIEREYGLWNTKKYTDALQCVFHSNTYHPIKQVIEALEWDGVSRIPKLLSTWMGADDNEYTREVSRLIFAGGIQRLYNPGCKYEDMPVLVGGQGAGKSSFVRFLAIEDRFFTELTTVEGKEGMEGVEGAWIVEVSELLALTKTKEQEAVKAYLSRLVDKYRPAYGQYILERPRTCAFIGTTNREQFITDKTGGRRFYPVACANTGYNLFDHEKECREYIKQCWAEAYAKRHTAFMAAYADRNVKLHIEQMQQLATEDDLRVGLIESYLEKLDSPYVCSGMIWECALGNAYNKPERADQTQIGLIMQNMPGWKRSNYKRDFGKYGKQRHWQRVSPISAPQPTYETPNDYTPF